MMLPWVEKYRPRTFRDVVDQEEAKYALASWICARFKAPEQFCKAWAKSKDKKVSEARAVLLAGPPGVGKTTLVHALANEINYELVELNASDVRTAERIKEVVGRGLREGSLFGYAGRLILFDEVDGLNPKEDLGGLDSIIDLIETARVPIVMTANNPWDQRLRPLRDISLVVSLRRLAEDDVVEVLRRICGSEKIKCEEDALRALARSSDGDLRAAINDLQLFAGGKNMLTVDDIKRVGERNPQLSMFEVLDRVFRANWFDDARSISFMPSFDWEQFFAWASENIPKVYKDPSVAATALDRLSKADVVLARIKKTGEWELMPYMTEIMLAGVALVPGKPRLPRFFRYQFPQRILMLARSREARRRRELIVQYLSQELHVSTGYVSSELLNILLFLSKKDERILDKISRYLSISMTDIKTLFSG
ncbi:MAG: replication factor C large subunit [Thermoproteus sp.]|nr:replication factor C large subunit [Thermoproteus sp.]